MSQFKMFKGDSCLFRRRLRAKDYRIIDESSEAYHNRSDCENDVDLVRSEAPLGQAQS